MSSPKCSTSSSSWPGSHLRQTTPSAGWRPGSAQSWGCRPDQIMKPGSAEERAEFARLQATLPALFETIVPDRRAPRTIVVVPSLSVDQDVASGIPGIHHYEERMLGMLMLLGLPRTRLVYLSSQPIAETIIDYYLSLLQGVPTQHARQRLTLLACFDS